MGIYSVSLAAVDTYPDVVKKMYLLLIISGNVAMSRYEVQVVTILFLDFVMTDIHLVKN